MQSKDELFSTPVRPHGLRNLADSRCCIEHSGAGLKPLLLLLHAAREGQLCSYIDIDKRPVHTRLQ